MYEYKESTADDHYNAILDHLDSLQDKFKDEIQASLSQVDSLQDRLEEAENDVEEARNEASFYKDEALTAKARLNTAYSQRAIVAVTLAHTVLSYGGRAGIGRDDREDQPDAWRVVLYVDTHAGQLSWHISPDDQPMLEGLPIYGGKWDGTWNSSNVDFYKGFNKRG